MGQEGWYWEKGTADRRVRGTPGPRPQEDVAGLSSLREQSPGSLSSTFQSGLSPEVQSSAQGTCLVSPAAEPFLGQLQRFGVLGRPWEGCRDRYPFREGPQGPGAGQSLSPAGPASL